MINVTLFSDASTEKNVKHVLSKVLKSLMIPNQSAKLEKYSKGGYKISFSIDLQETSWEKAIFKVIIISQLIGRCWILTGDINEELDIWSNESSISGIKSIHIVCLNSFKI